MLFHITVRLARVEAHSVWTHQQLDRERGGIEGEREGGQSGRMKWGSRVLPHLNCGTCPS